MPILLGKIGDESDKILVHVLQHRRKVRPRECWSFWLAQLEIRYLQNPELWKNVSLYTGQVLGQHGRVWRNGRHGRNGWYGQQWHDATRWNAFNADYARDANGRFFANVQWTCRAMFQRMRGVISFAKARRERGMDSACPKKTPIIAWQRIHFTVY